MSDHLRYHDEVLAALRAASPFQDEEVLERVSAHVQKDRGGSELEYLGLSWPERRRVVKRGFSFSKLEDDRVLGIWDAIWKHSPNGDVLFAALDHYRPVVRKHVSPILWPVVRGWIDRVDNWAHADELANLYSWILAARRDEVYPQLVEWNRSSDEWERRISIVSLIHYSGKNAVFMPLEQVLPLVSRCLDDDRYYVQKAVGWVLREMGRVHPDEIRTFVEEHIETMSSTAFSRTIERRDPAERDELKRLRRERSGGSHASPRGRRRADQ